MKESGQVLKEILDAPDKSIPNVFSDGSKCVIILPSVKEMAFGIGASYGRGVMSCRTCYDYKGPWSAPIMMASSGGSIGFQIGGQATDFVIIVMNDGGARSLLNSKVKLGADASVATGPVGRTAEASTNARMQAQMLSYSRSQGVFGQSRFRDRPCAPTVMQTRNSMVKKSHHKKLSRERCLCHRTQAVDGRSAEVAKRIDKTVKRRISKTPGRSQ